MLEGALEKGIPMLIGSAGGSGSSPQVDLVREVVEEIAAERGYHFKMAVIKADQSKDYLHAKQRAGKIEPLGPIDEMTPEILTKPTKWSL